jgi:MFS family permease
MGQVGASSLPVFAAILATRHHHSAAAGYLMAAYAAGGLTGALGWTLRPARPRVAPYVVMVALIASGVPLAIAASVHQLATTAVFFAISGAFIGPMLGALFTSRQDEAPPQLRAQVFAVGAGVKTTAGACGAALAGLLAHLATSRQLLIAAAWPLAAGCLGLVVLLVPHARARRASGDSLDPSLDAVG